MEFTYETQGTNTYLVYELQETDSLDSISLNMLTNNKIRGFAQTLYNQIDTHRLVKYNVSAKIPVSEFFSGSVNRKRLLGVLTSITEGFLAAEEYMLDPADILLDLRYIFADVSTCEAWMICLPVERGAQVDLGGFFKTIMFNTQFDQGENVDYVAGIINFLNASPVFSLGKFHALLKELQKGQKPAAPSETAILVNPDSRRSAPPPRPAQPPVVRPATQGTVQSGAQQEQPKVPVAGAVAVPPVQQPVVQMPVAQPVQPQPQEKEMSFFGLMMHYSKENHEKYKAQQARKKQGGAPVPAQPVKEKKEKKGKKGQPPAMDFAIPGQSTPAVSQSVVSTPQPQVQPQPQGASQPQARPQPQPRPAAAPTTVQSGASPKFGETTVLKKKKEIGATTVLNMSMMTETALKPCLVRLKTQETIPVRGQVFRIGKEPSFVDYFIGDNGAISRSHANIIVREGCYFVVDTNSTNHTYLNGSMIASSTEVPIQPGDIIRLADEDFEFKLL